MKTLYLSAAHATMTDRANESGNDNKLLNHWQRLARQHIRQHPSRRIIKIYHDRQVYWIKRPEQTTTNVWSFLGRSVSRLSHNALIKPSTKTKGVSALKTEAGRLRQLSELGVNVPQVVAEGDDWIMLSDVGRTILEWVTEDAAAETKRSVMLLAAEQLARLHAQGLSHGRAALKDLAFDGRSIAFIDFEEETHTFMSPLQCMVRDFGLFCFSAHLCLKNDQALIEDAIEIYRQNAPEPVWREVCRIMDRTGSVCRLLAAMHRFIGRDGYNAFVTLKTLRKAAGAE